MVEVGSRDADSVCSGAKTPVLMEVVSTAEAEAEAEADSMAEETVILADPLMEAETEAEGREQALFFATGDAKAGAARARTGRTESRVDANIVVEYMYV